MRSDSAIASPCPSGSSHPLILRTANERREVPAGVEPASAVLHTTARPSGAGALKASQLCAGGSVLARSTHNHSKVDQCDKSDYCFGVTSAANIGLLSSLGSLALAEQPLSRRGV